MANINVPIDLWDDDGVGVISSWYFNDGDQVASGTVVAEVMVEKTSFEILAPADGELKITAPVETEIALGQTIGRVETQ